MPTSDGYSPEIPQLIAKWRDRADAEMYEPLGGRYWLLECANQLEAVAAKVGEDLTRLRKDSDYWRVKFEKEQKSASEWCEMQEREAELREKAEAEVLRLRDAHQQLRKAVYAKSDDWTEHAVRALAEAHREDSLFLDEHHDLDSAHRALQAAEAELTRLRERRAPKWWSYLKSLVTRITKADSFQVVRRERGNGQIHYQVLAWTNREATEVAHVEGSRHDAEFISACFAQAPLFESLWLPAPPPDRPAHKEQV